MTNQRLLNLKVWAIALLSTVALISIATSAKAADIPISCDVNELITAINTANNESLTPGPDHIILFSVEPCTYTLTSSDNDSDGPNGLPSITSEITIVGHGASIVRDSAEGTPRFRILHVAPSGILTLQNLTIAGGHTSVNGIRRIWAGGGIHNKGMLTVESSTIRNNKAGDGLIGGSNGTWDRKGGTGGDGGGIYNIGTLTLHNSTVSHNRSGNGGDGEDSQSSRDGGDGGDAGDGSGIYNYRGTLKLYFSTVSHNTPGDGGKPGDGQTVCSGEPLFCDYDGGYPGKDGEGGVFNDGALVISNSIIANSSRNGTDCKKSIFSYATVTEEGHNFVENDGNCGLPGGTSANLGPLQDNGGPTWTHALLKNSPAIDAGNCNGVTTDQRGSNRPVAAACDIGSFEAIDSDSDNIVDVNDNCAQIPNPDQANADGDEQGDICDPDDDNDTYPDDNDAFPFDPTEWLDTDGDGTGNNADPNDDNDSQLDADEIACGSDPLDATSTSPDFDGDNSPDCVDADDDNDSYPDNSDAFPLDPSEWVDTDGDGIGNNADPDDDNDLQLDADEIACGSDPLDASSLAPDADADNKPDCVDPGDIICGGYDVYMAPDGTYVAPTFAGNLIIGTNSNDHIRGTDDNDLILGLDGRDHLNGKLGNDVICGGPGHDWLYGHKGDDIIDGGPGWDDLIGAYGNDQLFGGAGFDILLGGRGNDQLWGEDGPDLLFGQHHDDMLDGGNGDDFCRGNSGAGDTIANCEGASAATLDDVDIADANDEGELSPEMVELLRENDLTDQIFLPLVTK